MEEWDLPSDADMLRWVERKHARVQPVMGRDRAEGWIVMEPVVDADDGLIWTTVGRGLTVLRALEHAYKASP